MASVYRYTLDGEVLEDFLRLSARQRQQLLAAFRLLSDNPFQKGGFPFRDSTDREIQKKIFSGWLISYWADHAVKEVRIVGIQTVRRQGKTP